LPATGGAWSTVLAVASIHGSQFLRRFYTVRAHIDVRTSRCLQAAAALCSSSVGGGAGRVLLATTWTGVKLNNSTVLCLLWIEGKNIKILPHLKIL
jgi:hypothetical protein